jgi:hypothetical protein
MLSGIITILGGIIAASAFILKRKPNAKELIDKITPYQGWIGICMFGWGVWELIGSLTHMSLMKASMLLWLFWFLSAVADFGVGFLLGFGLISKYALSKNEVAMQKGQQLRMKLVGVQVPLGFLAIAIGAIYTVWVVM